MKLLAAMLAIGMVASPSAKAEKPIHIAGIYSDLYYNEEAGDLLGTEVFIVFAAGKYMAFVQSAEGEPGPAIVVPATVERDHVSFTVPEPSDGAGMYDGRITSKSFEGTVTVFNKGARHSSHFRLPRKKSYWQ